MRIAGKCLQGRDWKRGGSHHGVTGTQGHVQVPGRGVEKPSGGCWRLTASSASLPSAEVTSELQLEHTLGFRSTCEF